MKKRQNRLKGKKDAIGNRKQPRLSLIPIEAMWALGDAFTYGEEHYGSHNWRNGIQVSYLIDAAMRHIEQFNAGEDIDQPSECHHLGCAMANLSMAIALSKRTDCDDRRK